MIKTRSITLSEQSSVLVGKVVVAHKGKLIPCWFPGKVEEKTSKGYLVKFLAKFESEDCTMKNIMSFDEYLARKNETTALFRVPAKLKTDHEEAFKLASKQHK